METEAIIVVVDALRFDEVPTDLIPKNFTVRRCRALSNITIPALATILSGKTPEEHGIKSITQADIRGRLGKVELLSRLLDPSFISSPAVDFHPFFTYSSYTRYSETIFIEAQRYLDRVRFMLLHLMDVHDLRETPGEARGFYQGFEPIPEEVLNWKPPSGLPRPYEDTLQYTKDAGWLKAKYRVAARRVFESLNPFIHSVRRSRVIISADHGESFTFWHHDGVYEDAVFEVPLVVNFETEDRVYRQDEIFRLVRRA